MSVARLALCCFEVVRFVHDKVREARYTFHLVWNVFAASITERNLQCTQLQHGSGRYLCRDAS